MTEDRDDILNRIVAGAEYLEREDITLEQREKAQKRYDELSKRLADMDSKPAEPARYVDPRVAEHIATIRQILKMDERRKEKQA